MSRVNCPACNSSTALGEIICFKCGYVNSFTTTPGYFSEEHQQKSKAILRVRDDLELSPRRFAPAALAWLYKAAIYDETIIKQTIAYCTEINKVLLPAFSNKELMFYQLRSLDDRGASPRYVTEGNTSNYTVKYIDHANKDLVIVEDHLSAIRIRKFSNVIALSSTKLNYVTIDYILDNFTKITFWLDADKPGRDALYTNLELLKYKADKRNVKCMFSNVYTCYEYQAVNYKKIVHDPKRYLNHQILSIINSETIKL